MKQTLAITLAGLQGLGTTDDGRERPVDRLTALALSQSVRGDQAARESFLCSLGGDLIAFKYSNRASSRPDAEEKLVRALGWDSRLTKKQRTKIASWAITEFAIDFCPTCRGAEKIPAQSDHEGAQPMKDCPGCGGTGKRRYSDSERVEAMGEAFSKAMDEAHTLMSWAEALAVRLVRERLR